MLDALTSLAFSVQSSKGIYALLLGSGLSSAAGIPTGWDITLDLIRKTAAASGEDCGPDAAAWYKTKHGGDADYSELLNGLAKSPADRANLLSAYFEQSADDLEKGLKAPTLAHKSIARLVAKGFIRVILTTNFDRLIERALESEGVSPTIISTVDMAKGALPLAHTRCTLIKVNGDYRDIRIRNTLAELESYEPDMDNLLDRVFDEYGTIVCGWSAAWDKALCSALLRSPSRRFTTYWTRRAGLTNEAKAIVVHRRATELEIDSADVFLSSLEAKIDAIDRFSQPHPASAKLAVVSLKKFIAESKRRIELRDLVTCETERVFAKLRPLPIAAAGMTVAKLFERMKLYENASETLVYLLAHGAFWGRPEHTRLWQDAIGRMAKLKTLDGGNTHLLSLRMYPACLLFYSVGMGALIGNNYGTLTQVLRNISVEDNGVEAPLTRVVLPWSILDHGIAKQLPGYENHRTPMSDRIFDVLREPLREYLPDDSDYANIFDRFEYLSALVHLDLRMLVNDLFHAPIGRFAWSVTSQSRSVVDRLSEEAERQGDDWIVVKSGLLSPVARFREVEAYYRKEILPRAWQL